MGKKEYEQSLYKILQVVVDEVRAGEMPDDINILGAIEMIKAESKLFWEAKT